MASYIEAAQPSTGWNLVKDGGHGEPGTVTHWRHLSDRAGPRRIQLRRTRGWKLPESTINVARPSRWGNPFPIAENGREAAVEKYRDYLETLLGSPGAPDIASLRGKNLACWCGLDQKCHADILLELANPTGGKIT